MKGLAMALLFASATLPSLVQSPTSVQDAPDVAVIKFNWSKERIGWQRDPFGGPIENFDEMRARARNEKRIDDAKRGGSADVDRIKREANVDAAIIEKTRQKGPPRYHFLYRVSVMNTGTKTIKAIHWDYSFSDAKTESEIGRRQFTSEEKIAPGKTREFRFLIPTPPTQTISVHALNKNERAGLGENVFIVRVEYSDGSVWQHP